MNQPHVHNGCVQHKIEKVYSTTCGTLFAKTMHPIVGQPHQLLRWMLYTQDAHVMCWCYVVPLHSDKAPSLFLHRHAKDASMWTKEHWFFVHPHHATYFLEDCIIQSKAPCAFFRKCFVLNIALGKPIIFDLTVLVAFIPLASSFISNSKLVKKIVHVPLVVQTLNTFQHTIFWYCLASPFLDPTNHVSFPLAPM